ncbi:MAG: ammonia-forming cytochrome c nitrite reductase subunit c552 [Armatimonadota bacterium]
MQTRILVGLSIAVLLVGAAILGGCGGTTHQTLEADGATFVGRATCAVCHSDIDALYTTTAHGEDFGDPAGNNSGLDFIRGFGGRCQPCHTVGFDEPSGFNPDGSTPHLESIGCEECHGPGSKHVEDPSGSSMKVAAVNRDEESGTKFMHIPIDQRTCWDCHVPDYKILTEGNTSITDASLLDTAPGRITVHHPQAVFLLGEYGYEHPPDPGPHALVDNTCVTCHLNEEQSSTPLATKNAEEATHGGDALEPDLTTCAQCHESEAEALEDFEELEEEINDLLIELGGEDPSEPGEPDESGSGGLLNAYAVANSIDLDNNSDPNNPVVQRYKGARHNWAFVLHDGSHGAHNPYFALDVLHEAEDLLTGP